MQPVLNSCATPAVAAAFAQAAPRAATFEGGGGDGFFLMLLQTTLALAFVCGLAYLIFRWVLPRLAAVRAAGSMVRVVDVVGLDARRRLYVIEVAGRWLLVAASEAGLQLVSELDAEAASEAERAASVGRAAWKGLAPATRGAFAERLARVMNRRK